MTLRRGWAGGQLGNRGRNHLGMAGAAGAVGAPPFGWRRKRPLSSGTLAMHLAQPPAPVVWSPIVAANASTLRSLFPLPPSPFTPSPLHPCRFLNLNL